MILHVASPVAPKKFTCNPAFLQPAMQQNVALHVAINYPLLLATLRNKLLCDMSIATCDVRPSLRGVFSFLAGALQVANKNCERVTSSATCHVSQSPSFALLIATKITSCNMAFSSFFKVF